MKKRAPALAVRAPNLDPPVFAELILVRYPWLSLTAVLVQAPLRPPGRTAGASAHSLHPHPPAPAWLLSKWQGYYRPLFKLSRDLHCPREGLQAADQGLPGPEGSPSPDSSHPLCVFKLTADNASITLPLPLCMPVHSEDSSSAKSVLVGPSLRACSLHWVLPLLRLIMALISSIMR